MNRTISNSVYVDVQAVLLQDDLQRTEHKCEAYFKEKCRFQFKDPIDESFQNKVVIRYNKRNENKSKNTEIF